MANFGIAFGAATNAAMNTFKGGLALNREIEEMRADSEIRDAMKNAPKVGDEVADTRADAQLAREAQARGLTFTDQQDQNARIAAINEARRANNVQGDFALAPTRTYTQADRDAAIISGLQNVGSPRALEMATRIRATNAQAGLQEAQLRQMQFGDQLRQAAALHELGQTDRAMSMLGGAFSLNEGSAHQGLMVRNPDGTVEARQVAPDGSVTGSMKFANFGAALQHAMRYTSDENLRFFMGQEHDSRERGLDRTSHEKIAAGNNAATLGAASLSANAQLAATRMREAGEQSRFTAGLGLRERELSLREGTERRQGQLTEAQIAESGERLSQLRRQGAQADATQTAVNRFTELARIPPRERSPEQQREMEALGLEIGTRDPQRLHTGQRRDADGITTPVTVNPYLDTARQGVLPPVTPNAIQNTLQQLGRRPAPGDVAAARAAWDQRFQGGGAAFDRMIAPQLTVQQPRRGGVPVE